MAEGKEVVLDRMGGFSSTATGRSPAPRGSHSLRHKTERPHADVTPDYVQSLSLRGADRELVRYLGEVGYATTEQVRQLFYPLHKQSLKAARQRLTQLWEWHLLDRVPCTGLEKYGLQPQLVYSLGKAGNLMLAESDAEGAKLRKRRGTTMLMLHNLLIGEWLVGLGQTGREQGGWDYQFFGERGTAVQFEHHERRIKMRPDGLLVLNNEVADVEIPLFIEMDTSMRELDHFRIKTAQYNAYFASRAWVSRFEVFPYVAVIVWSALAPEGRESDAANKKRQELTNLRIERIASKIKGAGKWTQGYTWLFARLDQARRGNFYMLAPEASELVKVNLFNTG